MENSGVENSSIEREKGKTINLDQAYYDSFNIKEAIVRNSERKTNTIRIFRGIREYDHDSIYKQSSNMMRSKKGSNLKVHHEMSQFVENLASNPTPENYQKVIEKSQELSINNFISDQPFNFKNGDFKYNLLSQHRNSIRNTTGTSPWLSATTNPLEAFKNAGPGGAIFVIDIPKDRVTQSYKVDKDEVLINGYLKENEISVILPIGKDDTTPLVDPFPSDEDKKEALKNLAEKLLPLN